MKEHFIYFAQYLPNSGKYIVLPNASSRPDDIEVIDYLGTYWYAPIDFIITAVQR